MTRCVGGSGRGERRHNRQDCLPYLRENLASMSFSRAVVGTVKGITEISSTSLKSYLEIFLKMFQFGSTHCLLCTT